MRQGNVVCPYTFGEIAGLLNAAFAEYEGGYFAPYSVRPKAVALSVGMSAIGITGIYFPFYAEANLNTNIPSYELGVTMAHELAHAHGVAQEGEANVVAYVLCLRSGDDYLRYGGADARRCVPAQFPSGRAVRGTVCPPAPADRAGVAQRG